MKRKNKTNKKVDSKKINNFIIKMITGKSYDEFVEENTKGMYLFEKKEFMKNLNYEIKQISVAIKEGGICQC